MEESGRELSRVRMRDFEYSQAVIPQHKVIIIINIITHKDYDNYIIYDIFCTCNNY